MKEWRQRLFFSFLVMKWVQYSNTNYPTVFYCEKKNCLFCHVVWNCPAFFSHTDLLQKSVAKLVTQVGVYVPCVSRSRAVCLKACATVTTLCSVSPVGTNASTNRRKRKRVQESNRVPASSDLGLSTNQIPVMVGLNKQEGLTREMMN